MVAAIGRGLRKLTSEAATAAVVDAASSLPQHWPDCSVVFEAKIDLVMGTAPLLKLFVPVLTHVYFAPSYR